MEISIRSNDDEKAQTYNVSTDEDMERLVEALGSKLGDYLYDMLKEKRFHQSDYMKFCQKLGEKLSTKMSIGVYVNATKDKDLLGSKDFKNLATVNIASIASILGDTF